ncbi:MAG: hypothetical protein DMF84_24320 [Acidobacteria bacterium]|jgi:hypothetical protein|nr:MAG: hypothetical protein DMF84_24320 [Acidobacteriota bacterium]
MRKHSSYVFQLTRHRAAFRLRQLLDEIQMLMGSFPDLRDAFDADELPVAFILKRDSRRSERAFGGPKRMAASVDSSHERRMKTNGAGSRARRRKQPSDD